MEKTESHLLPVPILHLITQGYLVEELKEAWKAAVNHVFNCSVQELVSDLRFSNAIDAGKHKFESQA